MSADTVNKRIFINYRRGDSQAAAGRLNDRLLQHFGRDQVFMDVEAIEPGVDFVTWIDEQVAACGVFISVIGPDWLAARTADGRPRLSEPNDYVRLEIEAALKRNIRVIPVLVDGATMPQSTDLPNSIDALARRQAVEIAHHRFTADCDDLARGIKRAFGMAEAESPPATMLQHHSAPKRGWIDILFSFHGRISRLQFLIGFVAVLAIEVTLGVAISTTASSIFDGADAQPTDLPAKLKLFEGRVFSILEIASWWPVWALTLKRLHDFGHGWRILSLFIAVEIAVIALDWVGNDELSNQIMIFAVGITLMLAAIQGTKGPNKYGPDPLAKSPS
jgi:uncharacterized membrane protein YhaH (DUF805 family)